MSVISTHRRFLIQQYIDELQGLWQSFRFAQLSLDHDLTDLENIRDRITAQVDGLITTCGVDQSLLLERIDNEDKAIATVATIALLATSTGAEEVARRLTETSNEVQLIALVEALCHADISLIRDSLSKMTTTDSPKTASIAALAMARSGSLHLNRETVIGFMQDEDVNVRLRGWQIFAILENQSSSIATSSSPSTRAHIN